MYTELSGIRTWYEVEGAGDSLLLLHGILGTNDTWAPQRPTFASRYRLFLPERRAHGHTPDVDGPLSYVDMATDTIAFITSVVGGPAHLVGWSDGAIVSLLVAIARPDLVSKLVVIGANFEPSSTLPEMSGLLDQITPDNPDLQSYRSLYEAYSPDGPEHWAVVVTKLVQMARSQPTISLAELECISARTLVVVGDDDLVNLEHTVALYRAIPWSELAVVPGTSHALLREKPEFVNRLILDFLDNEPIATAWPVRRSAASH